MNLIDRFKQYYYLKKLGVNNAWLKIPLSYKDYYLIIFVIGIILIALVLNYANEIDNASTLTKKENASKAQHVSDLNNKNKMLELNLISLLNGSIKANGTILTYCKINSAGDCDE